ncbi:hypothetical protein P109_gp25 [Pelagibacter phage HTVC109P]|nr:hypothetical protein P109_gp25 [Pelagibacter phage HTVC109P]
MTDSSIFDDMDKPKKYCSCHKRKRKQEKQTVLWTVYHTILAVELGMIVIIEAIELLRGL